ncbi:MAG: TGS domain-containing protein [Ardenticatenaceae bacterium]|nr:TGS domain-containing protein [Ardenticatenaceae bacterium]
MTSPQQTAADTMRVFTPQGDELLLPVGATAIDFAYAVHLELGHECTGVLVNGRSTPLSSPLQDGDVVKILTSQVGVGPSPDWLDVVQTRRARSAIRHWLKEQAEAEDETTAVPISAHTLELTALTRPTLLTEITLLVAQSGQNMSRFQAEQVSGELTRVEVGLAAVPEVLLAKLRQVEGVQWVTVGVAQRPFSPAAISNPHTLRPVSGEGFFGRRAELRELVNNLRGVRPGEAVLLWGARRVGKTSLLMQFQQNVLGRGDYLPVFVDMQRLSGRSTSRFLHDIYKSIAEAIDEKPPTVTRMKRDPLGFFRSFLENEARLQDRHLVLILDEFQLLAELEEDGVTVADINRYFRSLIQHGRGLTVIFSGGGVLDVLLKQPAASFMLEVAVYQQIGCLDEAAARQLIEQSVARVQYEAAVVESLLSLTAGHPYYLQWVCGELVARAERHGRSHIMPTDLTTLLTEWLPGQGEQFFSHLWGSSVGLTREMQQRYKVVVTAVAQSNKTWQPLNKIARTLAPYLAESEVWRLAQDLVKMDTLLVLGKRYALKVPLFARWLRANVTVEGVVREE